MEATAPQKGNLQLLKKKISAKKEQSVSGDADANEGVYHGVDDAATAEGKAVEPSSGAHEGAATAQLGAAAAPTAATTRPGHWRVTWSCAQCARQCIPVRTESRCLCGHRYKEHKPVQNEGGGSNTSGEPPRFVCQSRNCRCNHFFFIVAEGAWILRCRCKHKHTDHDPSSRPHACTKARCECERFDSPWVCNCGHGWAMHQQEVSFVNTPNSSLFAAAMASAGVDVTPEMMGAMLEGMPDIATIDQCRPDGQL